EAANNDNGKAPHSPIPIEKFYFQGREIKFILMLKCISANDLLNPQSFQRCDERSGEAVKT
ncbi:hypothetical protein Ccrd_010260, partial [Cynara cardunculus var. scolymus]